MTSDRITPDMPTRTRSRCRSIRRPVLGCERLESRSMLAADLEMVDPTALVDAPLPPDTAFLADPLPADSIDSGAGCDWELLVACDGLVIVATDWDDTSTAESVPPDAPFDDGIPLGDFAIFDFSADDGEPDADSGDDAPEAASDSSDQLFPIACSVIPQAGDSIARAAPAADSPATPDASLLAWAGLAQAGNSVPVPALPPVAAPAAGSPGTIPLDAWATLGGSAVSPAALSAIDLSPGTTSPAGDLPSGDLPSLRTDGLRESIDAVLPDGLSG